MKKIVFYNRLQFMEPQKKRRDQNLYDDDGARLFTLDKIHPDRKFDAAMAGCLSWRCRLDALAKGAKPRAPSIPRRIR